MSAPQPQVSFGAILAGRWQIQDFIGSGEAGEVYGVRDMHGPAASALKLFWPNALRQAEIWSAVQQAARTAAGLGAEGVARAYEFGIDANSARPFFVSERVSWPSLADRVRLHGPLTPAEVSTALGVLARALDAAHGAGVVHRDLKPENVFVSPDNPNWVRVSDFGVALLRSASPPPPGWAGTMGWVAPDAADPNLRATPAMDVFALGLVVFFALGGGALHRAARSTPIDPGGLWQELTQPLDSASLRARELGASLDPAFDAWFQRAVMPMPQARFSNIAEMASTFAAIARTLTSPQSQTAQPPAPQPAQPHEPEPAQPHEPEPAQLHEAEPGPAQPPEPEPGSDPALQVSGAPAYAPRLNDASASALPGVRKRKAVPLLIGGAVLCLILAALGIGALHRQRSVLAIDASAAAPVTAPSAASAAPANPPLLADADAAAPSASVAVAATPAPVASAATAKALVAVKPAVSAPDKPVAAAAKPVAAAAKPVAAAAKPVAPAAKPVAKVAAPPKKKCGSTFIPCK